MNALIPSPWSACRKALWTVGLAALAGSALADDVARDAVHETAREPSSGSKLAIAIRQAQDERVVQADIPAVKSRRVASWDTPELPTSWNHADQRAEWYIDDSYLTAMDNFTTGSLFRTRKELMYRDTLRLLLTKRQVRVWIRDNLHLQCEVKRWHTVDDGNELGLKLGLYYRFD